MRFDLYSSHRKLTAMAAEAVDVADPVEVGATDLARAWEKSGTVRRRAAVYQLAL